MLGTYGDASMARMKMPATTAQTITLVLREPAYMPLGRTGPAGCPRREVSAREATPSGVEARERHSVRAAANSARDRYFALLTSGSLHLGNGVNTPGLVASG